MARWLRFQRAGEVGFGTLEGDGDGERVRVFSGDMFADPRPTGAEVPLGEVELLTPCRPSQLIGLWNNFRAAAAKQGGALPADPLWFTKAPGSFLPPGGTIRVPEHYDGRVVYEGEIGVVIGREARRVPEEEAGACIFGYTCVDDVTAVDLISRDPTFAQWCRAKSFDTFGPFGPVIATGLDPSGLSVRTLVNGRVRQDYPVADMIFSPRALVSLISREVTLQPGDLIACGTSVGVGPLRNGCTVEVAIEGIGTLSNAFAPGRA